MRYIKYINTIIGKIGIIEEEGKIVEVTIGEELIENGDIIKKNTKVLQESEKQLKEYFEGKRKIFELQINPKGTEFMKNVWQELEKIPYGKTATYKEIAERIGNPKAARAVGMANNKNPIPIIIPCHRVIGANEKLVGYALGLSMKERLLELEDCENFGGNV